MIKTCYVCLPIAGQEDTVIERANMASIMVERLGMIPLTPMEINDEEQDILDNPDRPVDEFMGRDIQALIGRCQAIYVCKGWEKSKGCCVELECAKQYEKEIFYEELPKNLSFKETVLIKFKYLLQEYKGANELHGPGSLEVALIKRKIDEYKVFFQEYFDWKEFLYNNGEA